MVSQQEIANAKQRANYEMKTKVWSAMPIKAEEKERLQKVTMETHEIVYTIHFPLLLNFCSIL